MDSDYKPIIFLACIFLFVGIVMNILGAVDINEAEQDLFRTDNQWDYSEKSSRLNHSIRTSRILSVSGNALIVLTVLLILILYLENIYKKVESIQLEINSLKYGIELEQSIENNIEKNDHTKG